MALDLSELKFVVDDSDLKRASDTIGNLVTSVGKLDKAARDAAQTEVVLAKAAKLNADANLQNAKAQDVRLKSTITADKADQQAADAIERKTKATERASTAIKKNADMLQLQNDTYDFILEGFSKGDAKVLAMAKATGQLSDQLKQVLTDIRQFSKNTFDQTETGLDRMVKSAKEASSAQGFLNSGLNLTSKQAKELSNDLDRLNIRLQHQGKSYQEITKEQAIYKQRFVEEANAVNRATSALATVEKQRKDVVSATNYLTQSEAKMAAALNTSNAAIDKAGTDSLVKYESALRKSGISQDVATAKLATYKAQLTQVAGLEEKRRAQHLARALQPQFTDIAVSLYSGQAPLTVLLQQSGQMVDLFKLSGIEADNLGKVMREAFASMIPAIAEVAKGLTSLVFESFMSAGSAVTRFVGDVTGITAAMEIFKRFIVSGGEANFKYIASLDKIGKTFSAVAATGIAAMIAGMILLGLEYKKIIQAEAELTNALATSGGALGISKTEAIAAAEGMASFGVGTLKAVAAITEIAKSGNIGKESIDLITKSAVDLEKTAGISIEETVKQFAKLQEEPSKALTEIAQKTGFVNKATLDSVYALEQQGDKTKAAHKATLAFASSNAQVAAEVRDNWSPIEALWNDIKSAIGSVKQEIYDLTTSNAVVGALRTVWETVAVVISEVWFTIKGVGKEIGGIGAQIAAVMQGDFSGAAEIGRTMKADAASAAEEQKKYVEAILNRTSVEQKSFNQSKVQNYQYTKWRKENDQALDKSISKTDKYKAKELEMQKAVLAGTVSQIEADKALAGWKKIILGEEKTKKDPSENYYATLMREATNNTIAANTAAQELTKSEQKLLEVRSDPRFEKLTATQKQDVISKYEAAIAAEKQTALTEKLADAEEHRLKLLGKSEGIGKQYYSDMQKLEEFAKVAGWSREEIEELTRAVFMATPAWKAYEKALEDVNSAARKFNEDSIASQAATLKENESLDYRLSLLGKTTEEQKALSIEYNRANKISEVRIKLAKQLRDIEVDIEKAKKAGLPEENYKNLIDAQVQARKDAAEQEKVINREVAVQYREDFQREFIDPIRNGLTDSIVTALFEGGKAGSKKLRDVLVNTLRQRVTIVVDAVVNTLVGSVIGSTVGGAGGANTVQTGFSALNGSISSTIGNAFSKFAGSSVGQSLGLSNAQAIAGNNPSAYVPPGGELTARGQAMGNAMGVIGDTLAGYALGSMTRSLISGGYSVGKGMDNFQKAGIAVGSALGGPVAGAIIGAGAGLVNRAFGRKLKDSGIQGTFGGQSGFEGESFEFYKGGWFRSDKTKTSPLDEEVRKTLGDAFNAMRVEVGTFATLLGLETDRLAGFTTSIKISTKGLDEEAAQEKIQEALATANNELAEQVIGSWQQTVETISRTIITGDNTEAGNGLVETQFDEVITKTSYTASEYAKEGEKAIDTLRRLATSLGTVNAIWDNLGYTVYEASLRGADAASKIGEAFGGLEAMAAQFDTYIDQYYTEDEKRTNLARSSANALQSVGLAVSAEDILGASRPIVRGFVEAVLAEFGPSSPQYVAAVQQANVIAGLYTDVTDAVSGLSEVMKGLKEETANLEIELLRAKGDTARANAAQRALDTQGFTEAEIAVYDYNQSIRDQIKVLTEASNLEREISDNRRDYADRILQQEAELLAAQGRTVEADKKRRELLDRQRARENERLMALSPELARLAYELWLLEDATVAAANAAALEREISDNRRDYTDRILQQEAALLDAQGRTAEADKKRRELLDRQRARENERLMKINPELAKLAYELWLLEDATAAATRAAQERKEISDDLYNALVKAVDAEKTLLNEQKARLEETISTLKAVFDILKSSIEDLYGEVSSTAAMQASEGRGVIAQAIATGILPDSKLLDTSIQAVRDEISNSLYVSKADADKARLIFAAQLALLKDTTEEQLTDAEKQLKAVNAQISYLDNILKTSKEQLDAFLGNTEVLKSVDKALADLYAFLQNPSAAKPVPKPVGTEKPSTSTGTGGGAVFGPGGGGGSSQSYSHYRPVGLGTSIGYQPVTDEATISRLDKLSSLYHSFDGTGDLVGLLNSIKAAGGTMYDLEALSGYFYNDWVKAGMSVGIPAFAEGGNYRGGVALVGEEGPELINFSNPGQVYTARQTASMLSGESSEVVAELKAVRSEIIMLRAEVRADVSHNAKTAKLLDRVIPEGDSVQVTIS